MLWLDLQKVILSKHFHCQSKATGCQRNKCRQHEKDFGRSIVVHINVDDNIIHKGTNFIPFLPIGEIKITPLFE